MKPFVALLVLLSVMLVGMCVGKKDKSKDYQIGTFVSVSAVADGTITSTLHGDGTTVAGNVYSNQVRAYTIKVADGSWYVETMREAQDSRFRNWGQTPVHLKAERANPLDFLKSGDRVLFRLEQHHKLNGIFTSMYVPYADNPEKEVEFATRFVPNAPAEQPKKPTDNVKAICDAHKLSPELEKEYCSAPTPAPIAVPTHIEQAPATPTAQAADTRQQDQKMAEFKRMCDSGMFTKGAYANQPFFQQQCDLAFPKDVPKPETTPAH